MKRKSIYILLAISFTCTMFSSCKKNDSIETVNIVEETVNTIESESDTEETETTTVEEIESTIEVVESTEETEATTVEEVTTTETTEISEGQQFRNETAQKMVEQAKEYYEQGLITKEEYDGIIEGAKTLEEGIQWDLPEDLTTPHIDVDVPGGTPDDPSSYGDYHLGEGGELPPELQGRHTQ